MCAFSRPRLSLGVTLPGRYQPGPRLSTSYRLDQPWGAHRRLARVSMSGTAGGGHVMRRNPCGSHGRPPSGPPGTEGTVLICPLCGWPPGTARWGFNSDSWGFNSVARSSGRKLSQRGRLSPRCPEDGASRCGCRSPALARGAAPAATFAVSAAHAPGLRSLAALPPPWPARCPARQGLGCVSLGW